MKIIYDNKTDIAYIDLGGKSVPEDVNLTYTCDAQQINGLINLEFSFDGRLLGLEILDATNKLPSDLLKRAEAKKG